HKPIVYIKMERTNCFGTCPHYILEIHENGFVKYTGKMYAEPTGTWETTIDKTTVTEIFKEFQEHRVDTCREKYVSFVQDVPSLNYEIIYSDKGVQTIRDAAFGPDFLNILGKKIDDKIKPDDSWKKTADYKPRD